MNMNNLMAQAQKMQKDMEKKQKEIYDSEYIGESQIVTVILKGDKTVLNVKIKPMDKFEIEDVEMLEDRIKVAMNDAITKIDKDIESKMGIYGKQLGGLF